MTGRLSTSTRRATPSPDPGRRYHGHDGDVDPFLAAATDDRAGAGDRTGRRAPRIRLRLRAPAAAAGPGARVDAGRRPPSPGDARRARARRSSSSASCSRRARIWCRRRWSPSSGCCRTRFALPLRGGGTGDSPGAEGGRRRAVRELRRGARRGRLDRPGASRRAAERPQGRRQGAAAERAGPDRGRPGAAAPRGASGQATRGEPRLHRCRGAGGRVRAIDPQRARLPHRGAQRGRDAQQLRENERVRIPKVYWTYSGVRCSRWSGSPGRSWASSIWWRCRWTSGGGWRCCSPTRGWR